MIEILKLVWKLSTQVMSMVLLGFAIYHMSKFEGSHDTYQGISALLCLACAYGGKARG